MMTSIPITVRGIERLRKILQELKTQKRPQITAAIAEARAYGDLKENAEYHAAKEEQSLVEKRIAELESKLAQMTIIDPCALGSIKKIVFGATVHLWDINAKTLLSYQIVGGEEADIQVGLLSIHSPLARALVSKKVGDTIIVQVPAGEKIFEIREIKN
jgi:transcription elongation factor GreA